MRQAIMAPKVLSALADRTVPMSLDPPHGLIFGHMYVTYKQGGYGKVREEVRKIVLPLFDKTCIAM